MLDFAHVQGSIGASVLTVCNADVVIGQHLSIDCYQSHMDTTLGDMWKSEAELLSRSLLIGSDALRLGV